MSVTLKIEGSSPEETEYLREVLYQAFPHWKFNSKAEPDKSTERSVVWQFKNSDDIDGGFLQQKKAIKEQYPELIREGIETFETEDEFFDWLIKPSFGLFGKTPLSLIVAGEKEEVQKELIRIQYGDLS